MRLIGLDGMVGMGALGLIFVVLGGCQSAAPDSAGILSAEIFEDIPSPRSARVQTDHALSFSYASDSFRCAKYVYRFDGEVDEVVDFFHEVMGGPPYSWTLKSEDELPSGHARLNFRKGEEYCTVDIQSNNARAKKDDLILITILVNYE